MSTETASGRVPEGPTGRQIITFAEVDPGTAMRELHDVAGLDLANARDVGAFGTLEEVDADGVYLEALNIAIVDAPPDRAGALSRAVDDSASPILAVEPEVYVYAFDTIEETTTFEDLETGDDTQDDEVDAAETYVDTATYAWGLKAVRAVPPILHTAPWSGTGIRIAVLDTGIDLGHPDFVGRVLASQSFIPNQAVQDGHSHGTHCAGTAAGIKKPPGGQRRYGVAHGARLLIGKVLSNSGSGTSGQILAGIDWAIRQGAHVISMSLGSAVAVGQTYFVYYEQAAVAALNAGSLIVAAAGNSGWAPVGAPANSPSVLAVAALDQSLQRASFSCVALNGGGGEINVAAPGVATYSSVPVDKGSYGFKNGTSMATPHVAGIAASLAQKTGFRGRALWSELERTAVPLPQSAQEVGKGLAVVPTRRMGIVVQPPTPWRPGPIIDPGPIPPAP
ncbi:S8 family serine peptidase [Agromyces sp. Soil535]|uniref:S8 family serine peptidase n=1 Tax=Agromyces sp. Soil535 TaxID=1736390 RepID=UPI000AC568DB|nr:S8 family serine peptidase [Agromyces sp. Soil535]